MQAVLEVVRRNGGWYHGLSLQIANPPHAPLYIEALDESGPCGLPALSVTQFCGSDTSVRAPEMHFEISRTLWSRPTLNPFYLRNDCLGTEEWSRFIDSDQYVYLPRLHSVHRQMAGAWNATLDLQGYTQAFQRQRRVTSR